MKHTVENHYSLDLKINNNPYDLDINRLFTLATRNNPKRKFLFVSRVLGKHLPVKPFIALNYCKLLAACLYEVLTDKKAIDKNEILEAIKQETNIHSELLRKTKYQLDTNTIFIGLAETATGMTHSIFESFASSSGMYHTTRECVKWDKPVIKFEEAHSHATSHYIYNQEGVEISAAQRVIIVDDEITTGNTLLNFMKTIKSAYGISEFYVLTYLDWRDDEGMRIFEAFKQSENVEITVISLLKGEIDQFEEGKLETDHIRNHELFEGSVCDETDELYEKGIVKSVYVDFFSDMEDYRDKCGAIKNYCSFTGRFGLTVKEQKKLMKNIELTKEKLQSYVQGKTLILGTEEFMYIPLRIANELEGDIYFKSTTRSPIFPLDNGNYPIKGGIKFRSTYNKNIINYLYNVEQDKYDTIMLFIEKVDKDRANYQLLYTKLQKHCKQVYLIQIGANDENLLDYPPLIGTYDQEDVVFLLKEIDDQVKERDNKTREKLIQGGVHYSEMLPIEYSPTPAYMDIYKRTLKENAYKLAEAVGLTASKIYKTRSKNTVLVSLVRGGTPAGILVKRYIHQTYNVNYPHYSISIIRGKGIDENALKFILFNHPDAEIQFVDGWTGKGAIVSELKAAIDKFQVKYGYNDKLNYEFAVISDPGHCAEIYGTREDFLVPNACLNATVSGLVSRSFHRNDLIQDRDYHGVKFYKHLKSDDLSESFINTISRHFSHVVSRVNEELDTFSLLSEKIEWTGMEEVKRIQKDFCIENVNLIKPGLGETTRVLLRREPWKILVNENSDNLSHVMQLAEERNVPIETYPLRNYSCCGLVKLL